MYDLQVEVQAKKRLVRVNWHTVERIIVLLYRNGMMKKTNIAMSGRLRYDRCSLHLNWCKSLKLIKTRFGDDGHELISLTDRGMELYREQFAHTQLDL